MKKIIFLGVVVLIGIGIVVGLNAQRATPPSETYVVGEALVQFKADVSEAQALRLIQEAGAAVKERIDPQQIYVVSFPESIPAAEMVQRFRKLPEVAVVEFNGLYEVFAWNLLFPCEAYAEPSEGQLGAGARVVVAVIDTAIDATHSELAGNVIGGYNFTNNTTNTQSRGRGQDWHGTASSGRVMDGAGEANVQIMPVQVFGEYGGASWSSIIKAINYAVDNGAKVINMSLGGRGYSSLLQQAVDQAVAAGVTVVASSGNSYREEKMYPAAYNGVISVAATNEGGKKANFSTYGSWVDMSAPGDWMRLLSHGGYRFSRGTSFSAPFIAGMAALLRSAFPSLTVPQVEQIFKSKARDVDTQNQRYAGKLGAGFLNSSDVKRWMQQIRNGTFTFPWSDGGVNEPVEPGGSIPPTQPWLIRGKGNYTTFTVTPGGEILRSKK